MKMMAEALAEKGLTAETAKASLAATTPETTTTTTTEPAQEISQGVKIEESQIATVTPVTEDDDIVSRVLKATPKSVQTNTEVDSADTDTKFNFNDIEKITDPEARKYAETAYKSMEKGVQKKFQEAAELRKQLEREIAELKTWTPEKVDSLLSNQEFIQAAQAKLQATNPTEGELSDDEWSALSPKEKSEFKAMQSKLLQMENNNKSLQMKQELERQVQDLSTKYASFDKSKVIGMLTDINAGKFSATLEHIHKVVDYEDAIRRAYRMGKEDRQLDVKEKSAVSTIDVTGAVQPSSTETKRLEGESSSAFLKRRLLDRWQETQKTKKL
jgi:protein-tyrosine-phosphatase